MVIKRNTRDVVPKLAALRLDQQQDMSTTRLDILHEIVERVLREKPREMRAAAGTGRN